MTDYYLTNAPEVYDYTYVETVKTASIPDNGKLYSRGPWRLIKVADVFRFTSYQLPRYASGLFQAYMPGSEGAEYLGLPATVDECLKQCSGKDNDDDKNS